MVNKDESGQLAKVVAKGAGVTLFGDVFGKALTFMGQVVIARLVGVEFFGLYALGLVLLNVAQVVSTLGFSQAALRYVAIYSGSEDRPRLKGAIIQCIGLPFAVGSALGLLLFLSSDMLAAAFHKPDLAPVIRIVSFGVPLMSSMLVAVQATRGFHKMHYFVYVRNVFYPLANLTLVVVLVHHFGLRLSGALWALVAAIGLSLLLSLRCIGKELPDFAEVRASYSTREMLRFSGPLALAATLQLLLMRIDIIMLGSLQPSADAGVYNAASQVVTLLFAGLIALSSVFSPMVADLYNKGSLARMDDLLKVVAKWTFLLTLPMFVVIAVCCRSVLSLFGPEFLAGSVPLLILAAFTFLTVSMGPLGQALAMSGKSHIVLYNTAASLFINIILNLLLIPRLGMTGAALATGASLVCLQVGRLVEARYVLGLWPLSRAYLNGLLAGVVTAGVALFVDSMTRPMGHPGRLILTTLLVIPTFLLALFILGFSGEDKVVIGAILRKLGVATIVPWPARKD